MSGKLDQLARAAELERKAKDAVYRGALEAVAAGFNEIQVAAVTGRVPATVKRWVDRATQHDACRGFGCEDCDHGHLPLASVLDNYREGR
ncbi:MAG TPA: hypothetical protein VFX35_01310 [Solirubrobacterales bacterium]|nr:hypothetical protein [Solirubrobacterales bacterium]